MDRTKIEEYIQIYQRQKDNYNIFCKKLKDLITSVLDDSNIVYHIIESRVKSIESFREKLLREGKNYSNPLEEITDFTGVRVILYYQNDVEKVVNIIKREFKIDSGNSIDKKKLLKENEFGYLSVHLIASLNKTRGQLPEWKLVKNLKAEIQIRTVLQHSWASISHALQYKREMDIPTQFRRKLNRLAGLLELADEEFESLKTEQLALGKQISKSISNKKYDLPINMLTIEDYKKNSDAISVFTKIINEHEKLVYDDFEYQEGENYNATSQLIMVLNYFNIKSIEELNNILENNKELIKPFFEKLIPKEGAWGGVEETFLIVFLIALLSKEDEDVINIYNEIGWHEAFLKEELIKYRITAGNNV